MFKNDGSKFINKAKLNFELIDNGIKWYSLKEKLSFFDGKSVINIPSETFLTDGATIPKYLHRWLNPIDKAYLRSAILHDFLYTEKHISRLKSDYLFLKALRSEDVNFFIRQIMFLSVRLFGRHYYNR